MNFAPRKHLLPQNKTLTTWIQCVVGISQVSFIKTQLSIDILGFLNGLALSLMF